MGDTAATTDRTESSAAAHGGPRLARPVRAALLALVTSILVACGNQAVTPAPTVGYGSPRPSVSIAPTPSPSPDPAAKAIDAFVALVTNKGFSYQATFTGQDRHSTTIL